MRVAWFRVPGKGVCSGMLSIFFLRNFPFPHHLTCLFWHLLPLPWLWFPWLQQVGPPRLQTDAILYSKPQCHRLALDSLVSTLWISLYVIWELINKYHFVWLEDRKGVLALNIKPEKNWVRNTAHFFSLFTSVTVWRQMESQRFSSPTKTSAGGSNRSKFFGLTSRHLFVIGRDASSSIIILFHLILAILFFLGRLCVCVLGINLWALTWGSLSTRMLGAPPLQRSSAAARASVTPRRCWLKWEVTFRAQISCLFWQMWSSNTVKTGHGAGLWGHSAPDSLGGCPLPHIALGLLPGLGEWQETSLCYSQPCFHRPTLAQASRQTVSLLERFEEQKCVFDKRHHVLYGSSMFDNIFPALGFLLFIW